MKDETLRVMKLVEQGKISAEDALELLEALKSAPDSAAAQEKAKAESAAASGESAGTASQGERTQSAESEAVQDGAQAGDKKDDPVTKFFSQIEEIGKSVASGIDWKNVTSQVNTGVNKGLEGLKKAADEARKSGAFSAIFGAEMNRDYELPLAVPSGKTLRIEGNQSNVRLISTQGVGSVTIDATFRAATTAEAEKKAELFMPMVQESDHLVLLKLPDGHDAFCEVVAHVTEGTPVEIKVTTGDLMVEGLMASIRAESTSGDVTLAMARGVVDVKVASGDVSLNDIEASLMTVETTSGEVTMTRCRGVMNVRSGSGNVTLHGCRGRTLSLETTSGDVAADLDEPVQGSLDVRTVSGDVMIEVPDGSDCRVNLKTLRGKSESKLALTDEQTGPGSISGRLGGGVGSLTATAVSGNVTLQLRDATVQ